ncbi:hypothetical protein ACIBCA_31965 [Kitasatospora sp. NPDC051170]|uniref:hypothetical protein n=1 Tax=Kitasatospora sp. NPDC051170 TaxID=3364056 RepID=UPI0037B85BA6
MTTYQFPVVAEVRGVTAPARFSRLTDALAALLKTLNALPLGPDQQAYFAEPGYADEVRLRLLYRIRRDRRGVEDPLAELCEEVLFQRIFGLDEEEIARDRRI